MAQSTEVICAMGLGDMIWNLMDYWAVCGTGPWRPFVRTQDGGLRAGWESPTALWPLPVG